MFLIQEELNESLTIDERAKLENYMINKMNYMNSIGAKSYFPDLSIKINPLLQNKKTQREVISDKIYNYIREMLPFLVTNQTFSTAIFKTQKNIQWGDAQTRIKFDTRKKELKNEFENLIKLRENKNLSQILVEPFSFDEITIEGLKLYALSTITAYQTQIDRNSEYFQNLRQDYIDFFCRQSKINFYDFTKLYNLALFHSETKNLILEETTKPIFLSPEEIETRLKNNFRDELRIYKKIYPLLVEYIQKYGDKAIIHADYKNDNLFYNCNSAIIGDLGNLTRGNILNDISSLQILNSKDKLNLYSFTRKRIENRKERELNLDLNSSKIYKTLIVSSLAYSIKGLSFAFIKERDDLKDKYKNFTNYYKEWIKL